MCGGVGSRLRPLTESVPKPMIKILNRRVIDILINKLINVNIKDIYLSLGYMANDIIEFCESKNYNANIHFSIETIPLGTAGGVKNCISNTNDDVLVLSGDNIFDFDLNDAFDYHFSRDSDITICGITVDDPRDYGVVVCDDDGSICSFVEKPTWEQTTSFTVNTGIYIFKGNLLQMIPEGTFYDFSNDLFPKIFASEKQFLCYKVDGYWGDMGDFSAYRRITADILHGKLKHFEISGTKFGCDTILENGSVIIAPCVIGKNTEIKRGCKIGPNCVLGDNCIIEDSTSLDGVIIGDNCQIGSMCELKKCVLAENVKLFDNCNIEENSVISYGCTVGRFSRILQGCRVWPGRRIDAESVVSKDLFYETPMNVEFDIFGISGKINSQITAGDAVKIGQAISSLTGFSKIGIGCDDNDESDIYKNLVKSGIRTCGKLCYDFSEMFKTQAYFYSAYCALDAFIFVSVNGDIINFSFFGKYGMPVDRNVARKINNNFKFSSFSFADTGNYGDVFNLKLFSTVYKSYFKKICENSDPKCNIYVESENKLINDFFSEIFDVNTRYDKSLQILINKFGNELYVVEDGKFYSSERIFLLLCELEFAEGKTVVVPEEAPSFLEETAEKYNCSVVRVYDNNSVELKLSKESVIDSIWCFDPVLMLAKLIKVITDSGLSLEKLFEYQKDFALRKSIIDFDGEAGRVFSVLNRCAEKEKSEDVYFVIKTRNGNARLRQMGNANRIRMLVEAVDMETAKEIAVTVSEKIKNANIDKGY